MNYLAHFHLAGNNSGLLVGALLGDFVKGTIGGESFLAAARFDALPKRTIDGIALHRSVDASFDTLEETLALRATMDPRGRRYQGIAIDLMFDYLLSCNWGRLHHTTLKQYSNEVFALLAMYEHAFGDDARQFSQRLREHRLLEKYCERESIRRIAQGIAKRLGNNNTLCAQLDAMLEAEQQCLEHFENIYPKMQRLATQRASMLVRGNTHTL